MNILLRLLITITMLLSHVVVVSSEPLERSVYTDAVIKDQEAEHQETNSLLFRNHLRGLEEDIPTSCPNEHEEFVRCRSSSCFDKTCYQVQNPGAMRPCTRDCKSGCACKSGYVRNSDGLCYKEDICYSGYYDE